MSTRPICKNCEVCNGVRVLLVEYKRMLDTLERNVTPNISQHAMGYRHGQCSVLRDTISDVEGLLLYIFIERDIHAKGKGG